jgi:hypothetical protein
MASCVICHKRHRWWRTFFGTFTIAGWAFIDTRWVGCQRCGEHYCAKCRRSLEEATRGDHWWSRSSVRICRECGADISLPPPYTSEDY